MRGIIRAIGVLALLGMSCTAGAQNTPSHQVQTVAGSKATLEMVFVVDTTGSMSGLIDGAKQRVWAIVNDVLKSPTHPKVRVGLVAYRDHGDEYVTKVLPLTDDLDKVYSTLMDYKADGGGDTPEDVRQAMADGVHKAGWSQKSAHVAQILFLVGDAPPHDDYTQEPDTLTSTKEAVRAGIVVNAIECGNAEDTRVAWQAIAGHGEGQYFAIAQDGGVQTVATPYDKRLAELGAKLGTTYMAFGGGFGEGGRAFRAGAGKRQAAVESKVAAAAPMGAQADRAVNKALNSYAYSGDLLQSVENGTVKLESVKTEDLPDDLQKMTPEARQKVVAARLTERKKMRAEILALSNKRDVYLRKTQTQKTSGGKQAGFDVAVAKALKQQAARKGIRW